ncbi:MAG: DPP IV N-terminal domain-containing protein [Anaerolineae bacterium]|nr:DPP IV N-terminal domain-containing protein [Anaerolineae bacterium]MDQ7033303.1 DPP IV N-terminal domain-containing protein [Anaerolineae bacterium]
MKRYRRLMLTLILSVIVIAALFMGWLNQRVQNAPLELGDSTTDENSTTVVARDYAPPPSDLLLMSNREGTWDILLLNSAGDILNLTQDDSDAVDAFSSWSFNGTVINFLSNRLAVDELAPTQINVETGDLRALTAIETMMLLVREQQFDWDPLWSPDGTQILWASVRDFNLELYTIAIDADFDMSNATRHTRSQARDWYHSWSPDGRKITYSSDAAGNENIYVLDIASDEITQLTDNEADDTRPVWTVDGNQIVFASERDADFVSGEVRLYMMDADGSNQRAFDNEALAVGQVWSPDGNFVAWMAYTTSNQWHIFVRVINNDTVWRVTDGTGDYLFPAWRP